MSLAGACRRAAVAAATARATTLTTTTAATAISTTSKRLKPTAVIGSRSFTAIPKFAWGAPSHLSVGDECTVSKRFSAEDVLNYGRACGDFNPVHYPDGYAEKRALAQAAWDADPKTAGTPLATDRGIARFPGPIVHGMLTASLIGALFASHLPGAIYMSQSLTFRAPVMYDEEVTARVSVIKIEKRNRVTCRTTVEKTNAKGDTIVVIDGEAKVMLESLKQTNAQ